ncbi:MAG: hypothetical protein KDD19_06775 [Phaeodactylibacter sp.]|nr:hypothetical protein [Phaeodactylibacter sp.]MCB9051101.1 hypothetical protein [Lewinellaceae bacterium]
MRIALPFFISICLLALAASCGGDAPSSQQQQTGGTATDSATLSEEGNPDGYEASQLRARPDCQVPGDILEGNQFWIREQEILVVVKADSSTLDPDYGPGHRILEVYDTKNCTRIERQVLPVDVSPDFPYFIAEITYNNNSQLVAIHGFKLIYIYDVENRSLLPQLQPQYLSERSGVDAQSGMIQRLEVWEKYLVGYARDYGSFAFDLSNKQKPSPVLPFAEFEVETQVFHSLFLLESQSGYQAIMPSYDYEGDKFSVNPAFEKPLALNTDVPKSARNNRFLVLRQANAEKTALAFDLKARKTVALPANIASQQTQNILNWLKQNG